MDETDLCILNRLQNFARVNKVALAEAVNLSCANWSSKA
jgi:DNA-binding Lrp family transcriptional regulator